MSTTGDPLVCQACPTGSTTQGGTNSQDISACGKNGKLSFQISDILIFGDRRWLPFKSSKCRHKCLHTTNMFTHPIEIVIVQFIIFVVCAVDYYQTADNPLTCTACPAGSSTNDLTDQDACGKYGKIIIPIWR